jgi:hypothetical protein
LEILRSLVPVVAFLAWQHAGAAEPLTGEIFGQVKDVITSEPIPGATVVATSPGLMGEQSAVTDATGFYRLTQLPPGTYALAVSAPGFSDYELTGVELLVGREVKAPIDLLPASLVEEISVSGRAVRSSVDLGSASTGITVGKDYMDLAVPKLSIDIFDVAPGTTRDRRDASAIGGGSSNETSFTLDGVSINDLEVGGPSILLPTRFFEQVDIKTGGFLPEDASTTGGNINYLSKVGGNDLSGSIFTYITPYRWAMADRGTRGGGDTITVRLDQRYAQMLGFELGGPILKDRIWFHVGAAPQIYLEEAVRTVHRRVDRDGDGRPDFDEATDSFTVEPIAGGSRRYGVRFLETPYTAKLTFRPHADHRLTLGQIGLVQRSPDQYDEGLLNGNETGARNSYWSNNSLSSLAYEGKLLRGRLLASAGLSYRRFDDGWGPATDAAGARTILIHDGERDLVSFEPEWAEACGAPFVDDAGVLSPRCPVYGYNAGGFWGDGRGSFATLEARGDLTYRFDLFGRHRVKGGATVQRMTKDFRFTYSGPEGRKGFVAIDDAGTPDPEDDVYRTFRHAERGSTAEGLRYASVRDLPDGVVLSAFLQDSWMLFDRLTLVGGVRLDVQTVEAGPSSLHLTNLSPRAGVVYDVAGDGRGKLTASFARNFQILPFSATWSLDPQPGVSSAYARCDDVDPLRCPEDDSQRSFFAPEPVAPVPNLRGANIDTLQVGGELQVIESLVAGITYTHSALGRAIDDVPTATGDGFRIANPGEGEAARLTYFDEDLGEEVTLEIPRPERRYDAVTLSLSKTFARGLVGSASYTLAFLRGNFPGGGDNERDQFAPGALADYDSPDGHRNAYGWLPQDQRHQVKVDAAYVWEVMPGALELVPAAQVRYFSGTPRNYYGAREPFGGPVLLIPRGGAGRTGSLLELGAGLAAQVRLGGDRKLRVGLLFKNLLHQQQVLAHEPQYTSGFEGVRPIEGGDERDLRHVKNLDGKPVALDPAFGQATVYNQPRELRLELQLTF